MGDRSDVLPKGQRGRPSGPTRTDAYRVKQLHIAIDSVYRGPDTPLKSLARLVMVANRGPEDDQLCEREVRRICDSYRRDFDRPQQYDRTRHLNAAIGTRTWIGDGSPDLEHVGWCGWFPVKRRAAGGWIIERQFLRLLTQEEGEEQAAKESARTLIGMDLRNVIPSLETSSRP